MKASALASIKRDLQRLPQGGCALVAAFWSQVLIVSFMRPPVRGSRAAPITAQTRAVES